MPESMLSSPLAILVGIFCLTVSIFVHEFGHFIAARWRGARTPRFSIFGLGKPIISRKWRGVEWCICWIPFGAYVMVPQLADLGDVEGGEIDGLDMSGPPLGYFDKVAISIAGPLFNLILAVALASVLWVVGQNVSAEMATTKIGFVSPTIALSDGREEPSPAAKAGLQFGDIIRSIDGRETTEWQDVLEGIVFGYGSVDGKRSVTFVVERAGQPITVLLSPLLASSEKVRRIGISPYCEPKVYSVTPNSPGAKAGLLPEDRIDSINGVIVRSMLTLSEALRANQKHAIKMLILRSGEQLEVELPIGAAGGTDEKFGVLFTTDTTLAHINPFRQVAGFAGNSVRTLWSLINPFSDIRLSHMGGVVGIVDGLKQAAQAGPRYVLLFTILINVGLAFLNLLPIPVLDGGHIMFATIAKLRGRALNPEFVGKLQLIFFVLLISMMLYVSMHDIRRLTTNRQPAAEEKQPEKTPDPAAEPAPTNEPVPAKP